MEEWFTPKEVAEELDVHESAVYIAMREGRMGFDLKYGRKLVSRVALEEYKARTRPEGIKPTGRPKKSKV